MTTWEDNCLQQVIKETNLLSDVPRYYAIRYRAARQSHAVGLVTTKREGYFSPNGDIFYYDPNLHYVLKLRSRRDFAHFIGVAVGDYQGMTQLMQIRPR